MEACGHWHCPQSCHLLQDTPPGLQPVLEGGRTAVSPCVRATLGDESPWVPAPHTAAQGAFNRDASLGRKVPRGPARSAEQGLVTTVRDPNVSSRLCDSRRARLTCGGGVCRFLSGAKGRTPNAFVSSQMLKLTSWGTHHPSCACPQLTVSQRPCRCPEHRGSQEFCLSWDGMGGGGVAAGLWHNGASVLHP